MYQKLIITAVLSLFLFNNANAAVDKNCPKIEATSAAIAVEADKAYTQQSYTYANDKLSQQVSDAVAIINSPAFSSAVTKFSDTPNDQDTKVRSELADVAALLYQWEGENCFE